MYLAGCGPNRASREHWTPCPPKHMWHVSSSLPYSPSKQGHQFSGVRGFVAKSPVDLHKVCVLQLSTDGLQLVVRLVNNLGLYFRQGFGGVIPLSDSLPDSNQSGLCFPSSTSSTIFLSLPIPLIPSKAPYPHLNMRSFSGSAHVTSLYLRTGTWAMQESRSITP